MMFGFLNVNDLLTLIFQYQNLIPLIVIIGSVIIDDFSDVRDADNKKEIVGLLAERAISYVVILFIYTAIFNFLLGRICTLELMEKGNVIIL